MFKIFSSRSYQLMKKISFINNNNTQNVFYLFKDKNKTKNNTVTLIELKTF